MGLNPWADLEWACNSCTSCRRGLRLRVFLPKGPLWPLLGPIPGPCHLSSEDLGSQGKLLYMKECALLWYYGDQDLHQAQVTGTCNTCARAWFLSGMATEAC